MGYQNTQADIDVLSQQVKKLYIKQELLNINFQPIDEMQGELTTGSYHISTSDETRRSCDFTFRVKNKSYIVSQSSKIWFDKYVKLSLGIESIRLHEILWFPLGLFLFTENSYQYDSSNNLLTVKCPDLSAKLDGTRNGQIGNLTTIIPAGSNIRDSIISTIGQLGNIHKYLIADIGSEVGTGTDIVSEQNYNTVPYDLNFSVGCTVGEILIKLRDIYAGYESYFDGNTFIVQKIPTGVNETVILDEDIIEKYNLIFSEQRNNSLSNVKNVTEVWGDQIDYDRYSDVCTNTSNQYNVTVTNLTAIDDNTVIGFKVNTTNLANMTVKFNSIATIYRITDTSDVVIPANTFIAGQSYAFKIKGTKAYLLGQWQVHAVAMLVSTMPNDTQKAIYKSKFTNCDNITYIVNPDSQFTIENVAKDSTNPYIDGIILDVKSGNDYEKIYSNDLASQRAVFENWKTTRLEDKVTLEMQLIPWLDVNKLIRYKSKITGEINTYIIKDISISLLSGKMTVECIMYYPLYPDVI